MPWKHWRGGSQPLGAGEKPLPLPPQLYGLSHSDKAPVTPSSGFTAGFSSGETLVSVPWQIYSLTYIKPDISAPGVQVVSSIPGNEVAAFNGTSMAAPHVTGSAALLLSTEPALQGDPFATRAVLLGTIEDFGEAGRDQRFGFGRVDAHSAAEQTVALQ